MSASSVLAVGLPAAALIGGAKDLGFLGNANKSSFPIPTIFWVISAVIGFLLILRAFSEYRQRTYDQTWITHFKVEFDEDTMKQARHLASNTMKQFQGRLRTENSQLKDIDGVLDFFDELGFYVIGDQISPEVAHQSFYYWIRGYYTAARDYLEYYQSKESTTWEHIKPLYELTHEVERTASKGQFVGSLSAEKLNEFLDDEIALSKPGP